MTLNSGPRIHEAFNLDPNLDYTNPGLCKRNLGYVTHLRRRRWVEPRLQSRLGSDEPCKQLARFVSGWSTANGSYLVAVCVNAFNPDSNPD